MASQCSILLISLCFCAFFQPYCCDNDWSDCSKKDDSMKVHNVAISADSPIINVTYLLEEPKVVTNGTIIMSVKYGVVPYMYGTINLCDSLPQKCPVKPGQGCLILKNPIPSYKSPGLYSFNIVIQDQDSNELTCFNTQFQKPFMKKIV